LAHRQTSAAAPDPGADHVAWNADPFRNAEFMKRGENCFLLGAKRSVVGRVVAGLALSLRSAGTS
jgi:hypothetical protein